MTDPDPTKKDVISEKEIGSMRADIAALQASSRDPNLEPLSVDDLGETEARIWKDFNTLPKGIMNDEHYEQWMSFSVRVRALQNQIRGIDIMKKTDVQTQEVPGTRRLESIALLYAYIQGSIALKTADFLKKQIG